MWRIRSGFGRGRSRLAWCLAACLIFLPGVAAAQDHPKLFGSYEFYSPSVARFSHWMEMLKRFEAEAAGCDTITCTSDGWASLVAGLQGKPLGVQLREVNDLINAQRYVQDEVNWSDPDYWATPFEFLRKSGDCEDFAVAKYMALKAAGVPVENMRVAVIWDSSTRSGHAALVVYVGDVALLLDNLIASVVRADTVKHYWAMYSINETGWWLHKYVGDEVPQISATGAQDDTGG